VWAFLSRILLAMAEDNEKTQEVALLQKCLLSIVLISSLRGMKSADFVTCETAFLQHYLINIQAGGLCPT